MGNLKLSEHDEAVLFSDWLTKMGVRHWHPIQECVIKNPGYWNKMKNEGWNAGLPDYVIFVNADQCKYDRPLMVYVELKKQRTQKLNGELRALSSDGIEISDGQREFIDNINSVVDSTGAICFGADEAMQFVAKYLK